MKILTLDHKLSLFTTLYSAYQKFQETKICPAEGSLQLKKDLSEGLVCNRLEAGDPPKRIADLLVLPLAATKFDEFGMNGSCLFIGNAAMNGDLEI